MYQNRTRVSRGTRIKIVVFDIDGVIIDISKRLEEARRMQDYYDIFPREVFYTKKWLELDSPRRLGIQLLKALSKKYKIVLVTGRPSSLRKATIDQLKQYGILHRRDYEEILMRPENDRRPSWQVKADLLRKIREEDPTICIVEIHDDNINDLTAMGRIARGARLVLHLADHIEVIREHSLTREECIDP